MTTSDNTQKPLAMRVKLAFASLLSLVALVGTVSADINTTLYPIIASVTALFVPLLAVIIGAVPIIITMVIIGFIVGILAAILKQLNMS